MHSNKWDAATIRLLKLFEEKLILSHDEIQELKTIESNSNISIIKLLLKKEFSVEQNKIVKNWLLKLGEIKLLLKAKLIQEEHLEPIFSNISSRDNLVNFCSNSGWFDPKVLTKYLDKLKGLDFEKVNQTHLDPVVFDLLPPKLMIRYQAIPIFKLDKHLVIIIVNPDNIIVLDDIQQITGLKIHPVQTSSANFQRLIQEMIFNSDGEEVDFEHHEHNEIEKETLQADLEYAAQKRYESQEVASNREEESSVDGVSVVHIVSRILTMAISQEVSDIHIEATQFETIVRFRKDGILSQVLSLPNDKHPQIIARIKVLSGLDVAEKRVPQDGRMRYNSKEKVIDFRISTALSRYGETVVMRLIDRTKTIIPLTDLGIPPHEKSLLEKILTNTQGIFFVTGPTGSGKTTTLYASLNQLANPSLKIISVEDPVEFDLENIVQLPVNKKIGVTYAKLLKTILRQDPDIVMIGEVRDLETSKIAIETALTGHLVLTSIHTNDTVATITRLIEMGIEPFLIASVMLGAIAQRLIRKLCTSCPEPYTPTQDILSQLRLGHLDENEVKFFKAIGCDDCSHTGYKGRIGIFETLNFTDELKDMLLQGKSEGQIREEAIKNYGLRSLREQAVELVTSGKTTIEAVSTILVDAGDSPFMHCPQCQEKISKDYSQCPYCAHVLNVKCPQCKVKVLEEWTNCAECGFILKADSIFTAYKA